MASNKQRTIYKNYYKEKMEYLHSNADKGANKRTKNHHFDKEIVRIPMSSREGRLVRDNGNACWVEDTGKKWRLSDSGFECTKNWSCFCFENWQEVGNRIKKVRNS